MPGQPRLLTIPAACRSSITMVPNSDASRVVSLWMPSFRWSATRPCALPSAADDRRHRFQGRCPVRRSGPCRRDTARDRRRIFRSALDRYRGLGISPPFDSTASVLTPRSTPTTPSGRRGAGRLISVSTANDACQRPRSNRTVTDRTRAAPAATRSERRRPSSWSFTRPILGSTACRASQRNTPVVNRMEGRALRFDLNRGKPAGLPFRLPLREPPQFFSARASASSPVLKASLEHSAHHGATSPLAAFQSLRSEYSDHESAA